MAEDGDESPASANASWRSRELAPWVGNGPTAFVVGAMGGGKTHYASDLADRRGGVVLTATSRWAKPEYAEAKIAAACRAELPLLVIDDAQHMLCGRAEAQLESLAADPPAERLMIVSRRLPTFAAGADTVLSVQDLALSLIEIAAIRHNRHGLPIDLELASLIRHESSGWAGLARRLAFAVAPEKDYVGVATDIHELDTLAAPWLERVLGTLDAALVTTLERAAVLPWVDFSHVSRIMGARSAATVTAAIDDGLVMITRQGAGRVALPPLMRAHLLDRLPADERVRTAIAASTVLLAEGDPAGAADALAAGGGWGDLAELLERAPDAGGRAAHWRRFVPRPIAHDFPRIASALGRADQEDRLSIVLTSASGRTTTKQANLRVATTLAARGDEVGAVRHFRSCLRGNPSARTELLARFGLLLIRASITPVGDTVDGLCRVESLARDHALNGVARVVRGAIANAEPSFDRRAIREVVDQLEARGDRSGALFTRFLELLSRVRHGDLNAIAASTIAESAESLGATEVGAWARVVAAIASTAQNSPAKRVLTDAARRAATTADLPAALIVLDAIAPSRTASPEHDTLLADLRRRALEAGLPRVPLRVDSGGHPIVTTSQVAKVEVCCFGGFRLTVGGCEFDLKAVRPQARAVLRILALGGGAPLHRDIIASLMWGSLTQSSALHALHVSISSLRHQLPLGADSGVLVQRVGDAYRIGLHARADLDLAAFDAHLANAADAKARGDAAAARDGLVEALGLYIGEVLPEDGDAEWVVGARERYRLRAAEASNSLAHLHSRLGDVSEAVSAARRAVELDPWVDASWRTLITMHRQAGDVIASHRAEGDYHRMRASLGV